MVNYLLSIFKLFKINSFDFNLAYRYIYENGIIEDSAYPFYSGMIGSEVIISI
jgi:hypothetical protein